MRIPTIRNSLKGWGAIISLPIAVIYARAGLPLSPLVLVIAALPLVWLGARLHKARSFVDWPIFRAFNKYDRWPVHTKVFPLYKFVDLHRAAEMFVSEHPNILAIYSQHDESLDRILNNNFNSEYSRKRKTPVMIPRKINYDEEVFVPADTFWLLKVAENMTVGPAIIRVRLNQYSNEVYLEIAAEQTGAAATIMDGIIDLASRNSIYRNRMISVVFEPEVRDSYGDVDSAERFDIIFHKPLEITDSDIILDAGIKSVIGRTIVDFHNRRQQLVKLGLPAKRGVLFYGPPGTGKTYTCKYLAHQLECATTIVATGHSLAHIKSICNVAKLLQPALVLLEDIDLVFTDRQINPYSTILGEFMDQLDGFGDGDQIIFVLTTNAIERVEAAIKDRPGRVSQCIYFGPPSADLRSRYLHALLQPYNYASLRMPQVLERTEGVSQAFLKELVFRAVQIATEDGPVDEYAVQLANLHFDKALDEMTAGSGRYGRRIIGFHIDA